MRLDGSHSELHLYECTWPINPYHLKGMTNNTFKRRVNAIILSYFLEKMDHEVVPEVFPPQLEKNFWETLTKDMYETVLIMFLLTGPYVPN